MTTIRFFLLIVALAMSLPGLAEGQVLLNQVRLTEPITTETQTLITLTVADNVSVGHWLYVDREAMVATAVNTTLDTVTVGRGQGGTKAGPHFDDSIVFTGVATRFYFTDPSAGRCTATSAYPGGARPWINILTGGMFYCQDNLFGGSGATAGIWTSPQGDPSGFGRLAYTPIAYRTSRHPSRCFCGTA